ncbi:uncharacterized protein LOC132708037 isoform X1 [Cylas formicarius]|uniref:uncharacterized protein LOC132708037 isoform X1 n=1 Tax=Cylas formicarius TaxID=197179 RepID=UPI002958B62A|nr:uncharacterized protein LOC132708037 isoform X1 [Cylas formicarius]
MDYNNIYKMVLLMLLTETVRSWPNQRLAAQNKDTEIVYIPYDVKYVPIEVPESLSDQLSHRMLTTFPVHETILNQMGVKKNASFSILEKETDASKFHRSKREINPNSRNPLDHVVVRRQTYSAPYRRRLMYRPLVQYRRNFSSRRRIDVPPRRNALVGYLNDRDYFPTVA